MSGQPCGCDPEAGHVCDADKLKRLCQRVTEVVRDIRSVTSPRDQGMEHVQKRAMIVALERAVGEAGI